MVTTRSDYERRKRQQEIEPMKFYAGQIVFDKKRTDVTDDLLVVVDPDAGVVGDLSGETRRLVVGNEDNKRFGVTEETPIIDCVYIESGANEDPTLGDGPKGGGAYTFPVTRMETVHSREDDVLEGYQPYEWALATFLSTLFTEVEKGFGDFDMQDFQTLCMRADVDGRVIVKAAEMSIGPNRP